MDVLMSALIVPDVEQQALDALDRGDRAQALTLLMRAYGDDLYRHCRLVVGEDALADEVHQTVFVQAYEALLDFSRRSSLRTWLLGIARHRCLDALKLTRRWRRRFALMAQLPEVADRQVGPEGEAAVAGEVALLERALQRLSAEARIAVLLRYQEDLSFAEMAAICQEQASTLQARVARALPRLREWMDKHGR